MSELDLNSSVGDKYFTETSSKTITQIIHFKGGVKRTFNGVITNSIRQGQFTKFTCKNGAMVMVNDANVLMVETFKEED